MRFDNPILLDERVMLDLHKKSDDISPTLPVERHKPEPWVRLNDWIAEGPAQRHFLDDRLKRPDLDSHWNLTSGLAPDHLKPLAAFPMASRYGLWGGDPVGLLRPDPACILVRDLFAAMVQTVSLSSYSRLPLSAERTHFELGRYSYPLNKPLLEVDYTRLATALLGKSGSPELVRRSIHQNFQRLLRTEWPDQTENDRKIWELLVEYIDYDAYRKENPRAITRVGRLVSLDLQKVVIEWVGGEKEVFDFATVPGEIVVASRNQTVYATIRKRADGTIEWLSLEVAPAFQPDEELFRKNASSIRGVDDAVEGDWPSG